MQSFRIVYLLKSMLRYLALIAVSACGTAYQPIGTDDTGGYFHSKLDVDLYQVGFSANGFSEPKRAYDFAMLRAAELGHELGYRFFVIEGQDDRTSSRTYSSGSTSTISGQTVGESFYGTMQSTSNTYHVRKPGVVLSIRYFDEEPPRRAGRSYSISDIIGIIRASYQL